MSLTQYAARLLALRSEFRVAAIAAFAVIMPIIEEIRLRLIGPHPSA